MRQFLDWSQWISIGIGPLIIEILYLAGVLHPIPHWGWLYRWLLPGLLACDAAAAWRSYLAEHATYRRAERRIDTVEELERIIDGKMYATQCENARGREIAVVVPFGSIRGTKLFLKATWFFVRAAWRELTVERSQPNGSQLAARPTRKKE